MMSKKDEEIEQCYQDLEFKKRDEELDYILAFSDIRENGGA